LAAVSEIQERMATLNTQLRFGKHQQALIEAYKFRAYIQLGGARTPEAKQALQRVERVIASLEGQRLTGIQKFVSKLVTTARVSMNPTDEKADTTSLLDRFEDKEEDDVKKENKGAQAEAPAKNEPEKPLGDWQSEEQPLGEF
jgi:hypothetical protein